MTFPITMFINLIYKDTPELSTMRSSELDISVEKTLLVNPVCPVRIMLEYIRKACKLGIFTQFDLCGGNGALMGLFNMPTYAYATDKFQHKKTYYVIVVRQEKDKLHIYPQLNRTNPLYEDLRARVHKFMTTGEASPFSTSTVTIGKSATSRMTMKRK